MVHEKHFCTFCLLLCFIIISFAFFSPALPVRTFSCLFYNNGRLRVYPLRMWDYCVVIIIISFTPYCHNRWQEWSWRPACTLALIRSTSLPTLPSSPMYVSLSVPFRGRRSGLGQLLGEAIGVCHCPDYYHSWGALSDRSWGSLSEPHLSSHPLSFSLSFCLSLSVAWRGSLGATACGLCYAPCQAHAVQCIHANRTIAGNNDASGWQAGQSFRHIFVNRKPPASLCEKLGAGMASASGRGGSGRQPCSRLVWRHEMGTVMAEAARGGLRSSPSTWTGVAIHPPRRTQAYWEAGVLASDAALRLVMRGGAYIRTIRRLRWW